MNRGHGAGVCRLCGQIVWLNRARVAEVQRHPSAVQGGECRGSRYSPREEVRANA